MKMLVPADTTRQLFKETATMPKPTTQPAIPKQAAGTKATPHTTHTGQGKEGGASQSDQWPEHTESIPAQHTTHNEQNDRGGTENRDAEECGGKKQRTPASSRQEERRGSQESHTQTFKADQAFSQIKSDRTLAPNAKFVCLTLVTYMDDDGEASPTVALLADDTGLNRDTVSKHLKGLVETGWLLLDKRRDASGRLITVYKWL